MELRTQLRKVVVPVEDSLIQKNPFIVMRKGERKERGVSASGVSNGPQEEGGSVHSRSVWDEADTGEEFRNDRSLMRGDRPDRLKGHSPRGVASRANEGDNPARMQREGTPRERATSEGISKAHERLQRLQNSMESALAKLSFHEAPRQEGGTASRSVRKDSRESPRKHLRQRWEQVLHQSRHEWEEQLAQLSRMRLAQANEDLQVRSHHPRHFGSDERDTRNQSPGKLSPARFRLGRGDPARASREAPGTLSPRGQVSAADIHDLLDAAARASKEDAQSYRSQGESAAAVSRHRPTPPATTPPSPSKRMRPSPPSTCFPNKAASTTHVRPAPPRSREDLVAHLLQQRERLAARRSAEGVRSDLLAKLDAIVQRTLDREPPARSSAEGAGEEEGTIGLTDDVEQAEKGNERSINEEVAVPSGREEYETEMVSSAASEEEDEEDDEQDEEEEELDYEDYAGEDGPFRETEWVGELPWETPAESQSERLDETAGPMSRPHADRTVDGTDTGSEGRLQAPSSRDTGASAGKHSWVDSPLRVLREEETPARRTPPASPGLPPRLQQGNDQRVSSLWGRSTLSAGVTAEGPLPWSDERRRFALSPSSHGGRPSGERTRGSSPSPSHSAGARQMVSVESPFWQAAAGRGMGRAATMPPATPSAARQRPAGPSLFSPIPGTSGNGGGMGWNDDSPRARVIGRVIGDDALVPSRASSVRSTPAATAATPTGTPASLADSVNSIWNLSPRRSGADRRERSQSARTSPSASRPAGDPAVEGVAAGTNLSPRQMDLLRRTLDAPPSSRQSGSRFRPQSPAVSPSRRKAKASSKEEQQEKRARVARLVYGLDPATTPASPLRPTKQVSPSHRAGTERRPAQTSARPLPRSQPRPKERSVRFQTQPTPPTREVSSSRRDAPELPSQSSPGHNDDEEEDLLSRLGLASFVDRPQDTGTQLERMLEKQWRMQQADLLGIPGDGDEEEEEDGGAEG